MATTLRNLRCPACGVDRSSSCFGIRDSVFRSDEYPSYKLEVVLRTYAGRANITSQIQDLSLDDALALRRCLAEALRRLDSQLEDATGTPVAQLLDTPGE